MLQLINAEGSKFDTNLDNYLVINLVAQDKQTISYEQLEWIAEVTEEFHTQALLIEADYATSDVIDFLINIDKLKCYSRTERGTGVYYSVKRTQDELN